MFMGALLDAGVSLQTLEDTVAALGVGARLEVSRVVRSGISATKVDVWVDGEKDLPREEYWRREAQRGHEHSFSKAHKHSDHIHQPEVSTATEPPPHEHVHAHGHGRGLTEIREIIWRAEISPLAKKNAIAIFEALGRAEAKIHNTSIEQVHFHEVGAVDAMVDIVCAAVGAEALEVDELLCSPLNVGGGTVQCAHGTFPVPAPATLALLNDAPVYSSGLQAELVTPTGAAIVRTLASRFVAFPEMKVKKAGYGAGSRDFKGHPNVVRLTLGETGSQQRTGYSESETISVLEANLDDLNPQVFGYVVERLLEEGALDTFGMPVQMKKNRPGMLLTVLCNKQDVDKMTRLIFAETTTLGVRTREERRRTLARRWEKVETAWGSVRMKIADLSGTVTNYAPEYEDCRRIAIEHQVPLKQVMHEAMRSYLKNGEKV